MFNKLLVILSLFIFVSCSYFEKEDASEDFTIICIGNHQYYYRAPFPYYRGHTAIRLDDEGKPISCEED